MLGNRRFGRSPFQAHLLLEVGLFQLILLDNYLVEVSKEREFHRDDTDRPKYLFIMSEYCISGCLYPTCHVYVSQQEELISGGRPRETLSETARHESRQFPAIILKNDFQNSD
jgi:hypothetical protein